MPVQIVEKVFEGVDRYTDAFTFIGEIGYSMLHEVCSSDTSHSVTIKYYKEEEQPI